MIREEKRRLKRWYESEGCFGGRKRANKQVKGPERHQGMQIASRKSNKEMQAEQIMKLI